MPVAATLTFGTRSEVTVDDSYLVEAIVKGFSAGMTTKGFGTAC